ncbi:MAG: hypothetical protein JSV21_05365 [Nitrospirota bacterium]|nr:MAG: hypothetical protein JSV21_05365 [Nitrospirota bacterium]
MSSDMYRTDFREGKQEVAIVSKRGGSLGVCATFNDKYICCNVHVLRSVHNCPFECSYCFLQNYLTDGATRTVDDLDELMREVRSLTERQPWRLFRIGTWELGDSLALENVSAQAAGLIEEFSDIDNAVLELKTKSDSVDTILDADHSGRTVISWSLNASKVIDEEEHRTASLNRRLEAMKKVFHSGYLIGLHFDPMVLHDGWMDGYSELMYKVFRGISPERIAWISIGSLRFNPEMKKKMENNYPDSKLTSEEMVLGDDAKVRYVKPLRVMMYDHLLRELKKYIDNKILVYLCMERWDMWDKVLGYRPASSSHLDHMFAMSLYQRFRLGAFPPAIEDYEREKDITAV